MKHLLSIALLFGLLLASPQAHAQDSTQQELKILSWNIKMLPFSFIKKRNHHTRARKIAKELNKREYDIIVFQEAFRISSRKILKNKLRKKYPYIYGPARHWWNPTKTNSGIWVLSKTPLEELETIAFEDCEGTDCLARKGALLLEGNWKGNAFQVLGTHLDAGGPDKIRRNQFRELANKLLTKHQKEKVPQFICGDMNTAQSDRLYQEMLSILQAEDIELSENSDISFTSYNAKKQGKVIDYILLKKNKLKFSNLARSIRTIGEKWDLKNPVMVDTHGGLSDHLAVELIAEF
tara:strand:- start:2511 stop:3389 length:879 start_codon:yes stop_codon:yes gene_type:complete